MTARQWLRWSLLLPVVATAWYAVVAAGIYTHAWLEPTICPPEDMVSGFCHNQWVALILDVLDHTYVGLTAVVVIVSAAVVVPTHKEPIVWTALIAGLLIYYLVFTPNGDWSLYFAAATSGMLAALISVRWIRRRKSA